MYCPNCGSEIAEGVKFCSNCGKAVNSTPAEPKPVDMNELFGEYFSPAGNNEAHKARSTNPEQPVRPKKKKKKGSTFLGILVTIVVVIVVRLLVSLVFTGVDKGIEAAEEAIEQRKQEELDATLAAAETEEALQAALEAMDKQANGEANPEYLDIFNRNNIVVTSSIVAYVGVDERSFAIEDEDGWIFRYEFGYDDNAIEVMVDTIYIPLADYLPEEYADLEAYYREYFADVDALDFCSLDIATTADYMIITVVQEDMDDELNIEALEATGYMTTSGTGKLSMSLMAEGLLEEGYIEK